MSGLSVFDYNTNNIRFEDRNGRIWVSLTDMAKASGKQIGHWNSLKSTTEFLTALSESIVIPIDQIIYSNESSGSNESRGTWAIEEVAIEFAGWCSVQFKIWVNQQIKTLMTEGNVSLNPEPIEKPVLKQYTVIEYVEAQEKIENINNATLQELLRDMLIEELTVKRTNKALPATKPNEYTTLKVRAKELGYTAKQIGSGSALGKYMVKRIKPAFHERVGKYTVNYYLINDQLDNQIHTYLNKITQV